MTYSIRTLSGMRALPAAALLILGFLQHAAAAELRLSDVAAQEDGKRVTLRFTFSEPVKPDVTYFYTHNYVGLRASGLQFSSAQLKNQIPPPSAEAARAYRFVRFVQDRESGEIRLYLTKPLTPADAQVVPYDTYTEVTFLKPPGGARPAATVDEGKEEPDIESAAPVQPSLSQPVTPGPVPVESEPAEAAPPTLRPSAAPAADQPEEPEPVAETTSEPPAMELVPEPVAPQQPPTEQRIGGPSYTEFDLANVRVKQLEFKGIPFREAIMELVAGTGYNVVVSDDVDNTEVTLNFNQKQVSLKGALDLLALGFDLEWSVQPDAIVIKAK